MADIRTRSPGLRLVRNLSLLWFVLSLLALTGAGLLVVYGMVWGCVQSSVGWFGCVLGFSMALLAALSSLFMATVALAFAQMFFMAGVRVKEGGERPRFSVRGFFADIVFDLFD